MASFRLKISWLFGKPEFRKVIHFLNWFLDEPSEAIDDGKGVDGIDSGIGESETLDDHNDEVETEDSDSMSGTQDAKDSTNPSSLDQNPSFEDPPSSTEQIGDSLNDDQRDELEGEETEVQQEVKEENSDLEFKPESESGNFNTSSNSWPKFKFFSD